MNYSKKIAWKGGDPGKDSFLTLMTQYTEVLHIMIEDEGEQEKELDTAAWFII